MHSYTTEPPKYTHRLSRKQYLRNFTYRTRINFRWNFIASIEAGRMLFLKMSEKGLISSSFFACRSTLKHPSLFVWSLSLHKSDRIYFYSLSVLYQVLNRIYQKRWILRSVIYSHSVTSVLVFAYSYSFTVGRTIQDAIVKLPWGVFLRPFFSKLWNFETVMKLSHFSGILPKAQHHTITKNLRALIVLLLPSKGKSTPGKIVHLDLFSK